MSFYYQDMGAGGGDEVGSESSMALGASEKALPLHLLHEFSLQTLMVSSMGGQRE